jgi:esterase/lipase superfamily enzyme
MGQALWRRRRGLCEWAGVAVLASLLAGCSPETSMTALPLAVRDRGMGFTVPADKRALNIEVFYATNRAPDAAGGSGARYTSENGWDVRLGAADVHLGEAGWDWDRLARETLAGSRPAIRVARLEEFGVLGSGAEDRFASDINGSLEGCPRKDVTVYVPGFNQTFEEGFVRMAEFSYFLGHHGVFVVYAWPAHTHPFLYDVDRRHAMESIEGFVGFLRFLAERTDAQRIHLVTSSAGAPLVSGALTAMRAEHAGLGADELRRQTRLGQVIFAAADQGIDGFCALLAQGADEVSEHITVYSSSVDLGLVLSRHFGSGDRTIGRLPADLTDSDADLLRRHALRLTVVDATEAVGHMGRGDFWAHRYWYRNTWVSGDLLEVLREGAPPAARGLVPVHDGALWAFPPDYPERLRAGCGDPGDTLSRATGP